MAYSSLFIVQERQGIQFAYIKRNQLFFVFTSASRNILPAMALELLQAIVGRIHDFCGSLEEDNLRTNFVLIYELIDEIIVSIVYLLNSYCRISDTLK